MKLTVNYSLSLSLSLSLSHKPQIIVYLVDDY